MTSSVQPPEKRFRALRWLGCAVLAAAMTACTLNPAPSEQSFSGPPTVRLTSPQPNATYLEGIAVNMQAQVSNAGSNIDRVEFSVDNTIVATATNPNTTGAPTFSVMQSWTAAGVGAHNLSVVAFRTDGTASQAAVSSVNVIATAQIEPPTATATRERRNQNNNNSNETQAPTNTPEPTEIPATPTPDKPMATVNQGVNVRRGPGTNFNPPLGALPAGESTEILARNPAGDWYKVRFYNGDGWVLGSLVTVSGDVSDLTVDPGPPTPAPTPIPPTAVPFTPVPVSTANLVAGNIRLTPANPRCGETFQVDVDIANLGTGDTTVSGTLRVRDLVNGAVQGETTGAIPIIRAGATVASGNIPFTISTFYDQEHVIEVVLNPSGSIPETGNGDNRRELKYTLRKFNCP
jgi:hypothetical protein